MISIRTNSTATTPALYWNALQADKVRRTNAERNGTLFQLQPKLEDITVRNVSRQLLAWVGSLFSNSSPAITSEAQNAAWNFSAVKASRGSLPLGTGASAISEGTRLSMGQLTPELQSIKEVLGGAGGVQTCTLDGGLSPMTLRGEVSTRVEGGRGAASSIVNPAARLVGGVMELYNLFSNWGKASPVRGALSGVAAGMGIGSLIPIPGSTLIGGAVGGLVGVCSGLFGGKKPVDQKERDQFRTMLIEAGIIDRNWTIGLADGTRYDIGVDGHGREELGGRRPYEIDETNPLAGDVIGLLNPLIAVATGGHKNLQPAFVGYLVNASLSNCGGDIEKARTNVRAIYAQFKADSQVLIQGLVSLAQHGDITPEVLHAYLGGLCDVFSNDPYTPKAPRAAIASLPANFAESHM